MGQARPPDPEGRYPTLEAIARKWEPFGIETDLDCRPHPDGYATAVMKATHPDWPPATSIVAKLRRSTSSSACSLSHFQAAPERREDRAAHRRCLLVSPGRYG